MLLRMQTTIDDDDDGSVVGSGVAGVGLLSERHEG